MPKFSPGKTPAPPSHDAALTAEPHHIAPPYAGDRPFMGLTFVNASREEIRGAVLSASRRPYASICTPNVDIVVRYNRGTIPRTAVEDAALRICDSKILAMLARVRGKTLACYPGSDLVADILADLSVSGIRIAIVGPTREDIETLKQRFPWHRLSHIPAAARLTPGSPDWRSCLNACVLSDWDLLLICLGSPKQELLSVEIASAGRERGVALTVGASIDFLTGRQVRAPRMMQRLSLEWLHRLLRNPRRMWKRYLLDGPAIFLQFLRLEIWPMARSRAPLTGSRDGLR